MSKRLIILVTGLMKPHRSNKGIPQLYEELDDMWQKHDHRLFSTKILLYRWGSVEQILGHILNCRLMEGPLRITGIGHSYGVSTLLMVAKKLQDMNLRDRPVYFENIVSTDGVWRDKEDSPQFKSLFRYHSMICPTNIANLFGYFQDRGLITGHAIIPQEPTRFRLWQKVIDPDYPHWEMDNYPPFLELCKDIVLGESPWSS